MSLALNTVIVGGNLTRDPEVRYTPKGTAVCTLGLAINERFKDGSGTWQEDTTFVDIECWGKTAESAKEYLSKGRQVVIEGKLKLDTWERDGQKHSKTKVVAGRIHFVGGSDKPAGGSTRPSGQSDKPARAAQAEREPASREPVEDDDIPL